MKKLIALIALLFIVCGCQEKETVKPEYTFEIVSENIDMSAYSGILSTDHKFRKVSIDELYRTIDMKSSGVFYVATSTCGCCQNITKYLNEVAKEMDVTVYYVDVYDPDHDLSLAENQELYRNYLEEIMGTSDGEKVILTPHLIVIVNGEFYGSQICFDGLNLSDVSTEKEIEKIKSVYKKLLKPFTE